MTMTDEERIMLAAGAIMQIIDALPLDQAIGALMTIVADLIRSSRDPAMLWAALEFSAGQHRKLQDRFVCDPPTRMQ